MAKLKSIDAQHFRIPLDVPASDSTHGVMTSFELVTARVTDVDVQEGVGYTYTTGHNGGAIHHLLAREIPEVVAGADCELIEAVWQKVWWALHYGGRGGPSVLALSALDMALWDLKARRANLPLYRLLGGNDPKVPCLRRRHRPRPFSRGLAGADRRQPQKGLPRHQDQGRPRPAARGRRTDPRHAQAPGRRLPADGRCQHEMVGRRGDPPREGAARVRSGVAGGTDHSDDIAGHTRILRDGGLPVATGENFRTLWEFQQMISAGGVTYPEPDVTNCGGVTVFIKVAHLAEAFNLPVTSHGAHDVTVHLLAACPNRSFLETHGFGINTYIADPMRIEDGKAIAPGRPGHGVVFDWKRLEKVRA